jgi:mannose-6-phosphate isomerase
MELIKLEATLKDYIWGGNKLKQFYNKKTNMKIVAESWELSTHDDGSSIIVSGVDKGKLFKDYIQENGLDVVGSNSKNFPFFPILIKFIDARDNLSIQVHPSDDYALKNENSFGKTEVWYVLDAEPGAFLYYGFKDEITKEEMSERIKNNTFLEVLRKVEVKPGDVAFIESGTIHAIGSGLMICEIQQNSNLTYRVYDFGRVGKDGKPRELHIEKALSVTNLKPIPQEVKKPKLKNFDGYKLGNMATCQYFTTDFLDLDEEFEDVVDSTTFKSYTVVEGSGKISSKLEKFDCIKGDTFFAPAGIGRINISGNVKIIISYVD